MTVPSYDDLTPGIPDVVDSEAAGNLASLLRELPAPSSQLPAFAEATAGKPAFSSQLPALYACVRAAGSRKPEAGSGEPAAASRQLQAVLAIARDFSPRVCRAGERDVVLDVSGLGRLIGPPEEIARQLTRALVEAGAAASVGLGPTQTVARVLARATSDGHGVTLRHEDLCDLRGLCAGACARGPWQQLPVDWLQEFETLPPKMNARDRARIYETLERWGIVTLGALAALPAAELSSRLGRRGLALQRLARGLDAAPFVADVETPRYVGRLELEWPIETLEPLSFVFARLLEPLAARLERADRGAAAVRLDLRLTDRSTHQRVLQLPAAMRDPRVLRTLLLLDLESSPPFAAASERRREPPRSGGASAQRGGGGAPLSEVMIDVVTIELDPAPARITQFSLLQRALPSPETLSTLTARLSALVGESRVGSPVLVDSHAPDAFEMQRYAPGEGATGAKGANGATGASGAVPGAALRRERRSVVLSVSVERGRPVYIAASRRDVPYGAITQAAGPWRTSGGWWTTSGAGGWGQGNGAASGAEGWGLGNGAAVVAPKPRSGEGGWNRDEWDVALKSGAACRIYRDRTTDRWFMDGVYD